MNITIVGTGYVGLVTGTTLAELGNSVYCVDIDEKKVAGMKEGIVPIYEPNLEEMFLRNIQATRLFFTTDLKEALDKSEVIYLALPTPPGEDGSADLSYVLAVAKQVAFGESDCAFIRAAAGRKVDERIQSPSILNPDDKVDGFAFLQGCNRHLTQER